LEELHKLQITIGCDSGDGKSIFMNKPFAGEHTHQTCRNPLWGNGIKFSKFTCNLLQKARMK
jgi:hypothetical protein